MKGPRAISVRKWVKLSFIFFWNIILFCLCTFQYLKCFSLDLLRVNSMWDLSTCLILGCFYVLLMTFCWWHLTWTRRNPSSGKDHHAWVSAVWLWCWGNTCSWFVILCLDLMLYQDLVASLPSVRGTSPVQPGVGYLQHQGRDRAPMAGPAWSHWGCHVLRDNRQ